MISIWTGADANTLADQRRGNNLKYAARKAAHDYDAEIVRVSEVVAILRTNTPIPHRILLMLESDHQRTAK